MIPTTNLSTTEFTSFNLSERDTIESKTFTDIQRMGLINERSNIARQLLVLDYDPTNPHDFGIQQSYLRGQLSVITYLLDADEVARKELLTLIQSGE